MSIWETQRAVDTAGLIDNMVKIGGQLRERQADAKAEKAYRSGYAKALEEAKRTGNMPEEYQGVVAIDSMGRHIGVKVVALRELGKIAPTHPLVSSATVRKNIGTQTVINYSKAGRPQDPNYNDYAPSDTAAQKIYDLTLGN